MKCIDVSEWQGDINWKKVKADGYECAILRAGFGREASQKDSSFEDNYKNAKTAGVKLGAYWYSYATSAEIAEKEAKACLEVLNGRYFEMPVFFDMEESKMTSLSKSALTEIAKTFCNALIKAGYRAGVYSNLNWFTNYLDYDALRKLYPVWLAQYYKEAQLDCDVWQYSSEGRVSGIAGNVDMNVIYNTGIIKTEENKNETKPVYETASVQALLRLAYNMGFVKTFVTPVDNKKGKLTKAAIVEAREYLGYQNPSSTIDLDFISKLSAVLEENLSALSNRALGDVNGDGKVDIKDATQIQKKVAGLG